jgi:hypothetical protein
MDTAKLPDAQSYVIRHRYDIGDQSVTIAAPSGFDARRAAIYIQFRAEKWFGEEKMVTNLGIAAALVTFFRCRHWPRDERSEVIDMHIDREAMCGTALMDDPSLHRGGLREFISAHLQG